MRTLYVTLYLSLYKIVSEYVANIYEKGVEFDHDVRDRNYDILIVTPGKYKLSDIYIFSMLIFFVIFIHIKNLCYTFYFIFLTALQVQRLTS